MGICQEFFEYLFKKSKILVKSEKVLIKLFQKFAEFEAEPHFNAKASAFASMLKKDEVYFGFLDRVNTSRM